MEIKEFEGLTLKECLQQVRGAMGPDAVILETRKFRKGGVLGMGTREAVAIVAATGITVTGEKKQFHRQPSSRPIPPEPPTSAEPEPQSAAAQQAVRPAPVRPASAAMLAARGVYARRKSDSAAVPTPVIAPAEDDTELYQAILGDTSAPANTAGRAPHSEFTLPSRAPQELAASDGDPLPPTLPAQGAASSRLESTLRTAAPDSARTAYLERAMGEIRECLAALQREQREGHDRTVSAVVSAVGPAISAVNAAGFAALADELQPRFPEIQARLREVGVADQIVQELFDQLPDMSAWSAQAQDALAVSALRDLIARRATIAGAIQLTPGRPKTVALIGPTGVGKTTTIAKLAAHFALMQGKRVALVTVDTYRIAAVEQLKTYSQIIGIPVSVAYSHSDVPKILAQYAEYDLILIDTAGRSQQHTAQIEELKVLLEAVDCESHLVLSAQTREQDMLDAARRFAAARVDRLLFTKLDETLGYGTLLNVADATGLPLSYFTTGQKVPEDLECAVGSRLAALVLP